MNHFFLSLTLLAATTLACPDVFSHRSEHVDGYYAIPDGQMLLNQFYNNCNGIFDPEDFDRITDGAQISVYRDGCLIINANCRGHHSEIDTNSLYPAFETAHSVVAMALIHQHERGYFQWEDKISTYWPEFGANGKHNITFDQFMTGSSGLTHFDTFTYGVCAPIDRDEIQLWNEKAIIAQNLTWTPGSYYQSPYQVWGITAAMISRHVDPQGRLIDHYILDEFVNGTDMEVSFGLFAGEQWRRVRFAVRNREERKDTFKYWYDREIERSCPFNILPLPCMTLTFKVFESFLCTQRSDPLMLFHGEMQTGTYSPLFSTYTTAKSLAKLAQLMVGSNSFVSNATMERFTRSRYHGYDPLSFEDLHVNDLGYRLKSERYHIPDGAFASVSMWGSYVLYHPEKKLSIAYLTARVSNGTDTSHLSYRGLSLMNVALMDQPEVTESATSEQETFSSESSLPETTGTTGTVAYPCTEDWQCDAQPHAFCNNSGVCECFYGFVGDGNTCTCSSENISWEGPTGNQQPYCLSENECTQSWQCSSSVCNVPGGQIVGICS